MNVKKWIANQLETKNNDIEKLYKTEVALNFLLVWNMFEGIIFKNDFKTNKIQAKKFHDFTTKNKKEIDNLRDHFHERYQDTRKLRNLVNEDRNNPEWFERYLNMKASELSPTEAIQLLLYITLRFRNNIFHGVKGIESWLRFQTQIKNCTKFMMIVIDEELGNMVDL